MPTRRDYLLSVGGMVSLAGCTAPSASPRRTNASTNGTGGTPESDALTSQPQGPAATVRAFYRALLSENLDALNSALVHPESPTYPVRSRHLPPEAFQGFSKVVIDTVETVSVQSWVVQRLYPRPTATLDMKRAMGADAFQFVHTTFYLKKPDEKRAYEANTVDYTVKDDGEWYVRYSATRATHATQNRDSSSRNAT